MRHLWVRSEQRDHEERVAVTPQGAAKLIAAGIQVSIEQSQNRVIAIDKYKAAGCTIVAENSWPNAPADAIIFGLKELPVDGTPLRHQHIMFGHAFKGQPDGQILLKRFKNGGGSLYDLEYLVSENGRRVAAFGYWAGFAGAALSLKCWAAQQRGAICGRVDTYANSDLLVAEVHAEIKSVNTPAPNVIVVGALGRVGTGASDFCSALGIETTKWDITETAHGGPFPEILLHDVFINCILAAPGCPVFIPGSAMTAPRRLSVIADVACDPTSDFSPIKVYDRTTTWEEPALRVHQTPVLDVTAIDNLPSLLPLESSQDYASQLLPSLLTLIELDSGVWGRAKATFQNHMRTV